MKVDYISDLHVGFVLGNKRSNQQKVLDKIQTFVTRTLPEELGDVVIIAGDVDEFNLNILYTLEEYAKEYPKVLYVFGNHDLYLMSKSQKDKYKHSSLNKQEELKQLVNGSHARDKIHVLDNDTLTYKGVTFAGTMLWYTLPLEYDKMWWQENSNDSRYISPTGVNATEERHKRDIDFYQTLVESEESEESKVDVLITHIPPVHMNQKHLPSASYYNVDVQHLGIPVKHWICGHQHVRTVKQVNDTSIYNNSAGYVGEFKDAPKIKSFIVTGEIN